MVPFHAQFSVVSSIRSSRHRPVDSHIIVALITHNHIGLAITFLSVDKTRLWLSASFDLKQRRVLTRRIRAQMEDTW